MEWSNQKIPDIDTNFLYNSNRDAQFKQAVQPYVETLGEQEE